MHGSDLDRSLRRSPPEHMHACSGSGSTTTWPRSLHHCTYLAQGGAFLGPEGLRAHEEHDRSGHLPIIGPQGLKMPSFSLEARASNIAAFLALFLGSQKASVSGFCRRMGVKVSRCQRCRARDGMQVVCADYLSMYVPPARPATWSASAGFASGQTLHPVIHSATFAKWGPIGRQREGVGWLVHKCYYGHDWIDACRMADGEDQEGSRCSRVDSEWVSFYWYVTLSTHCCDR